MYRHSPFLSTPLLILLISILVSPVAFSQMLSTYDEGALGLAFALRKLPHTGSFLHTAAHPDDEDNSLLVALGRGRGLRTGLLTLTRGSGGQNEIGPELFDALGVLRTGELMSMHRYDGAEQFFTRAHDFGYSFSVEETLDKWGPKKILADIVRVIRTFRPDVIVMLPLKGTGGGQHHQASAHLTAEAFKAASDPKQFPEQIAEGLQTWQAKKLYERVGWGGSSSQNLDKNSLLNIETGLFDPLFGKTYFEIGTEARSMHRCQGMPQLIPLPGPRTSSWHLIDSVIENTPQETDLFDGIDTSLFAIEKYVSSQIDQVPFIHSMLSQIQLRIEDAQKIFDPSFPEKTAIYLSQGLELVRNLRTKILTSDLKKWEKYQLNFLLQKKEKDFQNALSLAHQLRLEVLSSDGLIEPGQQFKLQISLSNGSSQSLNIKEIQIKTPKEWKVLVPTNSPKTIPAQGVVKQDFTVTASNSGVFTEPYWKPGPREGHYQIIQPQFATLPWSPPVVTVEVELNNNNTNFRLAEPAQFRYEGTWIGGEQRHDLMVVPAVSVEVDPKITIIPQTQISQGRQVRVTATYQGTTKRHGTLEFELPDGWNISPKTFRFTFTKEGDSISKWFYLYPPINTHLGAFNIRVWADLNGQKYSRSLQSIDYQHIKRRHFYYPSQLQVKVVDVAVKPGLKLGYIMGTGDKVPEALNQLGVKFKLLEEDDLASSNLDSYNIIITGIRAYLTRKDLQTYNERLLEWVRRGGTLIVQYNKFEFNRTIPQANGRKIMSDSPWTPYPAQVSRNRITDENTAVEAILPTHPIFNFPNQLTNQDWNNWVQERGLYFLEQKDSRYQELVRMEDPFIYNSGKKHGALVITDYGQGKWLYIGLGLWRQLPAGVEGAYRLLANLISLGSPQNTQNINQTNH